MNVKETLNKEQAEQLFNENAVLFGSHDAIPEMLVVRLLGQNSLDFVRRQRSTETGLFAGYGIGEYTAFGLTKKGFLIAATYQNVSIIRDREQTVNKERHNRKMKGASRNADCT